MTDQTNSNTGKSANQVQVERYELVKKILGNETFIDHLDADQIVKAYSIFERNPQRITDTVIESFKQYCRKCIRETAIMEVKNELSQALAHEAETLRDKVTLDAFDQIRKDPTLEQLLIMLIFKNRFWEWVRFGIREIFDEQRMQPGHDINNYLNARFHKLKKVKNIKTIGDLVGADIVEIVNNFKGEVARRKISLFT